MLLMSSGVPYQLDQLADNQPRLSNFFVLKSGAIAEGTSTARVDLQPESEHSFLKGEIPKELKLSEVSNVTEDRGHGSRTCDEEVADLRVTKADSIGKSLEKAEADSSFKHIEKGGSICQESEDGYDKPSSLGSRAELNDRDTEEGASIMGEVRDSPTMPSISTINHCSKQSIRSPTYSELMKHSSSSHSTLGDPNFVENYFKVLLRCFCDLFVAF